MATTKLLRIKQTGGSNKSLHLKNSIFYICNPDKTEGGMYVGGNAGMAPKAIYQEMVRNKLFWNKDTGTQGFHYMLSCRGGILPDGQMYAMNGGQRNQAASLCYKQYNTYTALPHRYSRRGRS